MKNYLFILCLVLFATTAFSQISTCNVTNDLDAEKSFSLNAISYPIGLNGGDYRQLRLSYPILQGLSGQFNFIYDKSISSEIINSSFMFKWYLKEKLYLFAGLENEYETNMFTDGQYIIRSNFNFGVGYDVNPNFLLEFGYHQQINQPTEGLFENETKRKGFSLKAQF